MEEFWQSCATQLQQELTPQQFSAWIKPLAPLDFEEGRLRIAAPNRFKLDWVKTQFAARITTIAAEFWQGPVDVQFVLDPRTNAPKKPASQAPMSPAASVQSEAAAPPSGHAGEGNARRDQSKINPALTFDSFVTGKANQLARAAAIQVASNPGSSYNPLFLYGGVGLGKTHLIHAIGNQVLADNPSTKIRYIHAEQYVRDVVTAYQRKGFDDFKRY